MPAYFFRFAWNAFTAGPPSSTGRYAVNMMSLGVIVFAISGALVASRKQMDVVGFALLSTVTGIGGGTLRDLLLGQGPVFWVREPIYLIVCVIASGAVFVTAHIPKSRYRVLLWFDALGRRLVGGG